MAFTEKDLCTRCGTCVGVCPNGALSLDKDNYPEIDLDNCVQCGLCAKVCAGGSVNFAELSEITFGHKEATIDFDSHFLQSTIGYATDEKLRTGGASGGVVSALLWNMQKEGTIDGCIVTRMSRENPCRGELYIAKGYDEIRQSQQSKYVVTPVNSLLAKLRNLTGRYAIVALPCQVHGLRLL
ncbi:coenzyme F420 hydrogenase/dehydrogenase beta subunit N-terminal domain-containing protein [Desulfosediminicola ganghwensis]|uniref:coenzyme F420 hydrogenase/dehydrogenase beta subunit N-terminal domain-containing protein n=1 Tax=Desulfosediminicola ganghwensis TaxID=2569540 RepID=UPI001E64C2C2|nr:coenzyme F420 hydrogenase/dehydrogenase beta subunit N-terminal domain-containing protein [Desulfosediminicola ganghwensis]